MTGLLMLPVVEALPFLGMASRLSMALRFASLLAVSSDMPPIDVLKVVEQVDTSASRLASSESVEPIVVSKKRLALDEEPTDS